MSSRSSLKSTRREADRCLSGGDHVGAFVRLSHALKQAEAMEAAEPDAAGGSYSFSDDHRLQFVIPLYSFIILLIAQQQIGQILSARSKCLLKMGNHYLALQDALRLSDLEPSSVAGHLRAAEVYHDSCHFGLAHDAYLRCFQLSGGKREQDGYMDLMKACKKELARERAVDEKVYVY